MNLLPAGTTKSKRKFHPVDYCIVASNQRKKKAAFPKRKGRVKHLTVIVLMEVPATFPKCPLRNELRKVGRIKEIGFSKVDSEEEVNSEITYAFKGIELKSFQFLHAQKDNSLSVAANQQLDGLCATKLAGYGSLYIQELPETLSSPLNDVPSPSSSCDSMSDVRSSLAKSEEALALLMVPCVLLQVGNLV